MAQVFSVEQLKLNNLLLTGDANQLHYGTNQVAFFSAGGGGGGAASATTAFAAGSGMVGGGTLADNRSFDISGRSGIAVVDDYIYIPLNSIDATQLKGSIGIGQLANAYIDTAFTGAVSGKNGVYDQQVALGGKLEIGLKVDGSTLSYNNAIAKNYIEVAALGIQNSHIKVGTITNNRLANDSVTVGAGSGLVNGGEIDLGAAKIVDISGRSGISVANDYIYIAKQGIQDHHLKNASVSNSSLVHDGITVDTASGIEFVKADGTYTQALQDISLGGAVSLRVKPEDLDGDGLTNADGELKVDSTVIRTTSANGQTIGGQITLEGSVLINNLSTVGNITYINSQDMVIHDNIITLNTGDSGTPWGTGVSKGVAGFEIYRGSGHGTFPDGTPKPSASGVTRAQMLWNDNAGKDYWECGLSGDLTEIMLRRVEHTGDFASVSHHYNTLVTNLHNTGDTNWNLIQVNSGHLISTGNNLETQILSNDAELVTLRTATGNLQANKVDKTQQVIAGSGLVHGGALAGNVTLNCSGTTGITVLDNAIGIAPNAIDNSRLENKTMNFGGVSLALGGSDLTPLFNLEDATGYLSANLVGDIALGQLPNDGKINIAAGTGISLDMQTIALGGTAQLDVRIDDSSIGVNTTTDKLYIKTAGVTNGMLQNDSISFAGLDGIDSVVGSPISLGGTVNLAVDQTVVRTTGEQHIHGRKIFMSGCTFEKDLHIGGKLTVSGTMTSIESNEVNIGDAIIKLNADQPQNVGPTQNAGIEIERGSAANTSLLWDETTDQWVVNHPNGTTYPVVTERFTQRNTVALAKDDYQKHVQFGNAFAGLPSVTVTLQGVDINSDLVAAQLSKVETTGFVAQFSTPVTGTYKLHYVASDF